MSSQLRMSAYSALATVCAATALSAVFGDNGWLVPVLGGVVLVSGSCALIRHSALPSLLEPITAAIAVLCWITFEYARSTAHFGFIPGSQALRTLGSVARGGFRDVHRLPTPVPTHPGLVMLAVIGVAAIALVVDLMAVTMRRAALAGLPLLALFTVCAAVARHGVGVIPFVIAAVGYLWLLYADSRENVTRWGAAIGAAHRARPASAWSIDGSSGPASSSQSRRIGATAICLAVVLPLFIPGLHTGLRDHGTGDGGSGGNVTTINPIVSVANDLTTVANKPVLDYRSSSPDPGYLRLTSLDQFNGTTFSSPVLKAAASSSPSWNLPVIPPEGREVTTSIAVAPNVKLRWLPAPTTLLGTNVGSEWRYDPGTATVFSATTTTSGLRYTTRSVPNTPSPDELATAGEPNRTLAYDLLVPNDLSPRVKRLTHTITANATDAYQRALAIQRFFTGGHRFTYDATVPQDNSHDPLVNFLFNTKRGFCQQFATSMAVMARLAGIPARVAVGFTRGVQQANGTWLVKTHDAHAWPELWFQGYGWLAFEPTPRADGQAVTPPYATAQAAVNGQHNGTHPNQTAKGTQPTPGPPKKGLLRQTGAFNAGNGGTRHQRYPVHRSYLWVLLAIGLTVLLVPCVLRILTRRRRWRELHSPALAPAAAWAEVRDTAIDLGAPWHDGRTPRQIARDLHAAIGSGREVEGDLHRLVRAEELARYAPVADREIDDLRPAVDAVRSALWQSRTGWQRARSVLTPRSTQLIIREQLSRTVAMRDRIEQSLRRAAGAIRVRLGRPLTR